MCLTPECQKLEDMDFIDLEITSVDVEATSDLKKPFTAAGEIVDVVVFAAPQLSIIEMAELAALCSGRHRADATDVICLLYTSPSPRDRG